MESLIRQIEELQRTCCVWEVRAGRVPDHPDPCYTRTWTLTHEEWNSPWGAALFTARMGEALAYAARLHAPEVVSWVRLEWNWR
jgi:hypothetical protein